MVTASIIFFFTATFAVVTAIALSLWFLLDNSSGPDPALLRAEQLSSISAWHALLAKFDFVEILRKQLNQAGMPWSVGRLTLSMLLSGTLVLTVAWQISWIPLWVDIAVGWMAGLGPYWHVLRRRTRRFETFATQFPDALDSLSRGLRAGYPLRTALEAIAAEGIAPVGAEIRKVCVEMQLGLSIDRALRNLRERLPLPEVELFGAAVRLHSRAGGRLTDIVASLAESLREQDALRGEVRALATHGRVTGIILTILPIVIALTMAIVSPLYLGVLLSHAYSKHMIAGAIFCLILAQFVMRRIVDVRI